MNKTVQDVIAETQGMIYEMAADQDWDLGYFSAEYLKSDFCERAMDTIYSRFQFADAGECMDHITPEIPFKGYDDGLHFDPDVAYWIGSIYRYICFHSGYSSRYLADLLPFESMCARYEGFHTLDDIEATERICSELHEKQIDTFMEEI